MWNSLHRHRPVIFCEVLPDRGTTEALEALLAPLGYRYHILSCDGPRLVTASARMENGGIGYLCRQSEKWRWVKTGLGPDRAWSREKPAW